MKLIKFIKAVRENKRVLKTLGFDKRDFVKVK